MENGGSARARNSAAAGDFAGGDYDVVDAAGARSDADKNGPFEMNGDGLVLSASTPPPLTV